LSTLLRANTTTTSAQVPLPIQRFWPSSSQPPVTLVALHGAESNAAAVHMLSTHCLCELVNRPCEEADTDLMNIGNLALDA
jgi:hypothetical protein